MKNDRSHNTQDLTSIAYSHFRAGEYKETISICDKILQANPHNYQIVHLLGLSYFRKGELNQSLLILERAFQLKKSDVTIANSIALNHLALNNTEKAAKILSKFARNNALTAAGLNTFGESQLRLGKPKQALLYFKKALKLQPDLQPALINIGEALKELGRTNDSIAHYQFITQSNDPSPSAWRNLGLLLASKNNFIDAIIALKRYLSIAPQDNASRLALGSTMFKAGQAKDALKEFTTVLVTSPESAEAYNNIGLVHAFLMQTESAEAAFNKAIQLDKGLHAARANLAHLLHSSGSIDTAFDVINKAIAIKPTNPKSYMHRAHLHLVDGKIAAGWQDYRWRFNQAPGFAGKRNYPYPRWIGSKLNAKSILVWGEQGVGDEILYASIIPDLEKIAGSITIECEQRLAPLFTRSFPKCHIVARTPKENNQLLNKDFDYQVAIGDLCEFMRPTLDSFSPRRSYLIVNAEEKEQFVNRYRKSNNKTLLIGLAWHSGRKHDSWMKSIALKYFIPIISGVQATFVSLQYGDHKKEVDEIAMQAGTVIIHDNNVDSLKNLDSFAAQVSAMDLVITNSNTAAHMAGALGVPVWTLLPYTGSGGLLWYWFKSGSLSPWYKSMKLYRQSKSQSWTTVIKKVIIDLDNIANIPVSKYTKN